MTFTYRDRMTERCVEELSYRTATGSDHAVHPVIYVIYTKLRNTLSVRQESFYLAGTLGGPDNDEVLVPLTKLTFRSGCLVTPIGLC